MSKEEVITEIRRHNMSASDAFLAAFEVNQLTQYLSRLTQMGSTSNRMAHFVRAGRSPAISCRVH